MKKKMLLAALLLFGYALQSNAQVTFITPGATIDQLADSVDAHLNLADTFEGGREAQLGFFRAFWGDRVSTNDTTGPNMFERYYRSFDSAINLRLANSACLSYSGFRGNWRVFGPDSMTTQNIGKINSVWADPTDSNYILAGATGGLFKTTDGGLHWNCITDKSRIAGGVVAIGSIAVNPLRKNTIYIGTSMAWDEHQFIDGAISGGWQYGAGILKSFDGGNTWEQETGSPWWAQRVYFTPDSGRIYVCSTNKLYTRTNNPVGGWEDITPPGVPSDQFYTDLQFDPADQNHFFVSTLGSEATPAVIFESNVANPNLPIDWTDVSSSMPSTGSYFMGIAISFPNTDTLYAVGMTKAGAITLYKYKASGSTHSWSQWGSMPHYYANPTKKLYLVVSPTYPKNIYYGCDIPFFSSDFGTTFVPIADYGIPNLHADIRGLYLQKSTATTKGIDDILFVATDGGVSVKHSGTEAVWNDPVTFQNINGKGLSCNQSWGIGMSWNGKLMTIGAQHNGIETYEREEAPNWVRISGADGESADFDRTTNQGVAFINYINQPQKVIPAGTRQLGTYTSEPAIADAKSVFIQPLYIDAQGVQYTGMSKLWMLTPVATAWVDQGTSLGLTNIEGTNIRAITFSPYFNDLTGYVLHKAGSTTQQLQYRNPSDLSYVNFTNISTIPYTVPENIATCVTMNPRHPERVWLGMGGGQITNLHVQYSPDAGTHWYNTSFGLPWSLPVTKLVFQEGNNDIVYCATDAGIYQCDFSTFDPMATNYGIQWNCFSDGADPGVGFPNVFVTDLDINYCQGKLYASTYGRSIWWTDLGNIYDIVDKGDTIRTDAVWSGDKYISGAIIVEPGVTLTFNYATVHMPRNGVIKVLPGATLRVNNSKITNDCEGCMWYGIEALGYEVIGTVFPVHTSPAYYGLVTINNSIIEHARYAASNCDLWNYNHEAGGIIQASSSRFVNNHVSVSFAGYDNFYSGYLHDDPSYFNNCTFVIDNEYKGDSWSYPFSSHAYLTDVVGVHFRGCNFLNRSTLLAEKNKGDGIRSYEGGAFIVEPYCPSSMTSAGMPCPDPEIRSRFCGLRNGVAISNYWHLGIPASIDQADFDTVSVGVNISMIDQVATTRCNFKIGNGGSIADVQTESAACDQNIGILIQNAGNFRVEGNHFSGRDRGSAWYNFGIVAANTNKDELQTNRIYRNIFDTLSMATYVVGCNKGYPHSSLADNTGLQITCNSYDKNWNDIKIVPDATSAAFSPPGIAGIQAGVSVPYTYTSAANTFTHYTARITNNGGNFDYHYDPDPAVAAQNPGTGPNFTTNIFSLPNSCPSTLSTPGVAGSLIKLDFDKIEEHASVYTSSMATYNDTLAIYNSHIDFGNTDSLLNIVDTSTKKLPLLGVLLAGSPWLSETTLKAVADKGLLTKTQFVSVLTANACALRNPELASYVKDAYDISSFTMTTLKLLSLVNNDRTNLETVMSMSLMRASEETGQIRMGLYCSANPEISVTDTTGAGICTDTNSVYYNLDSNSVYGNLDYTDTVAQALSKPRMWPQYDRVGYYYLKQEYDVADSVFTEVTSHIPDGQVDNDYVNAWNVFYNAQANGRGLFFLNEDDIANIDTTSVPVFSRFAGAQLVRNLTAVIGTRINLNGRIADVLHGPVSIPCVLTSLPTGRPALTTVPKHRMISDIEDDAIELIVYPNPTGGIVSFTYDAPQAGGIDIILTNVLGETVAQLHSTNSTGKIDWDASKLSAGVYLYQVKSAGGLTTNGKIVVAR